MKKLVLTLVMGVFAFGMSGFISHNDCESYAADAALSEFNFYGPSATGILFIVYLDYLDACEFAGGPATMLEPIHIGG